MFYRINIFFSLFVFVSFWCHSLCVYYIYVICPCSDVSNTCNDWARLIVGWLEKKCSCTDELFQTDIVLDFVIARSTRNKMIIFDFAPLRHCAHTHLTFFFIMGDGPLVEKIFIDSRLTEIIELSFCANFGLWISVNERRRCLGTKPLRLPF